MITRKIILDSFQAVRKNTIQIAHDIPAEKYSFTPAEGVPSVLELFKDILRITEFMVGVSLKEEPVVITSESRDETFRRIITFNPDEITNKDEVIAALEKSILGIVERLESADEDFLHSTVVAPDKATKVRLWIAQCAKEQEMVIRAKLLLIERMLGIVPHTTRRQIEAQEKAKARSAQS